jgi:hypothetical protein
MLDDNAMLLLYGERVRQLREAAVERAHAARQRRAALRRSWTRIAGFRSIMRTLTSRNPTR